MRRSGRCKRVGQGEEALSARSHRAPLTALGCTAAWAETCHTTCFAKVWLRTFVATATGGRFGSARAVTQRRSDNAPRASQPWPSVMRCTPAKREMGGKMKKWVLSLTSPSVLAPRPV